MANPGEVQDDMETGSSLLNVSRRGPDGQARHTHRLSYVR